MTMIHTESKKCPVCGEEVEIRLLMSTNAMGYADLDLRPPEMQRSTMYQTTTMCNCGNVFESQSEGGFRELVESENYQNCDGIEFNSPKAIMFYRAYLIDKNANPDDLISNYFHILRAAWACDDTDNANAVKMREMATDLINAILEDKRYDDRKNDHLLMKADLLRRSGHFDELIDQFKDIRFENELYQQIIDFQIEKAAEKDDSCYTVGDVIGEERPY